MTKQQIELRTRRILMDTQEPYRWTSEAIHDEISDAIHHLNSIRPETRYIDGQLVDFVPIPEGMDEDISINQRFLESIVYYIVYKCYLIDDTDTVNAQLAEMYLQKSNTYAQL